MSRELNFIKMESFNNFDAVTFQPDSEKYWFFKGNECWSKKYGSDYEVEHRGLIEEKFTGVPNDLDAVVCNNKKYWFFKGEKCWSKEFGEQIKDRGSIYEQFPGLPKNIDSACFMKNKYWFFKGDKCWNKEHGDHDVIARGYINDKFIDAPINFDSIVATKEKYWFFKGNECWSKKYGGNYDVEYKGKTLGKFPFYVDIRNPESWMQDSLDTIGDKFLWQITIPKTHDSGMSVSKNGTAGATDANTKCQSKSVLGQLNDGVRYFDIRPIIGSGKFHTGHYTNTKKTILNWQGARGESIEDIINGINNFTSKNKELIILSLSHAYNTDTDYDDFSDEEWIKLLNLLKKNITYLFTTEKNLVNDVKIKEYITNSSAVLIIIPEKVKKILKNTKYSLGKGVYYENRLNIKAKSSSTNDVNIMTKHQLIELKKNPPCKNYLSMVCWTLTQSDPQAAVGAIDPLGYYVNSIEDLAKKANNRIHELMGEITEDNFPNIISVDYFNRKALSIAAYTNSLKK